MQGSSTTIHPARGADTSGAAPTAVAAAPPRLRTLSPRRLGWAVGIVLAVAATATLLLSGRPAHLAIGTGLAGGGCAALLTSRLLPVSPGRPLRLRRPTLRLLDTITRSSIGLGALWVVLNAALNPQPASTRYAPSENSGWDPALTALLVVIILLMVPRWWRASQRLTRLRPRTRAIVVCAAAASVLAAQLAVAWGMTKMPGFDAGIIIQSSYRHVFPAGADQGAISYYYMALPNNLLFGEIAYLYFLLCSWIGLSSLPVMLTGLIFLNCLVLDTGAVLTLAVTRRLGGGQMAVFLVPALLLFVVLSPWLNTPYSDTIALTLTILIVWIWMRRSGSTTWRSTVVLGAVAAVALLMKPTVAAVLVAIALVELAAAPPSLRRRDLGALPHLGAMAGATIVGAIGILGLIGASGLVSFNPLHNPEALPVTNFMVYGAHGTGGYNADDIAANWTMPPERRFLFNLRRYVEIVWQTGLFDYLLFLGGKALWMFADGSFFQGREGDGTLTYVHADGLSAGVRSVFAIDGTEHVLIASLWQASWLILLALLAVGIVVPTARRHLRVATVGRCALVLLVLFLLFSEGRSRYVYHFVPLVILVAGLVASQAGPWLRRARDGAVGALLGAPPAAVRRTPALAGQTPSDH